VIVENLPCLQWKLIPEMNQWEQTIQSNFGMK
jgi:hypothetical protein